MWMPIFVVLDIGAMMQLAFLIIEDSGFRPLVQALPMTFNGKNHREIRSAADDQQVDESLDLVGRAWITSIAALLGILLLVIQVFGLAMAAIGSQNKNVTADWCSTQFTRALAVESGCELYNITASSSQGIGCITLKGYEQYTWLTTSIIIISLSLIFEVFDLVILSLVRGTTRWRGVKMKRPWFTMFSGNIVLLVLIIVGVFQCQHLPKKIDQSVTVFEYQKELGQSVTSIARLTPYGVRGAVIGWTDGFLQSWGETYTPKSY
ncbi:hypothetical protein FPRO03_00002 [Fusarium proliferatum]|nr:hypothetical protein FPRO03_00002 [Fusarium proliferatum]